ncbi:MAG: hypothetical protein OEW39_13305, partial [Deltaproteobacteria bacterium]|nr:hypothetical protein [Deltaproteobacteria bacterium]
GLLDKAVVHTLVNLVQGRMLEYLADRICRDYQILDIASRQEIIRVLLRIFSDEFFALFRSKVEQRPTLVIRLARRITRAELNNSRVTSLLTLSSDRLYPAIFRKYFEYSNLGLLQQMVESDAEIQKILLLHLLANRLGDVDLLNRISSILESDSEGVAPSLFMEYLHAEDPHTLADKVATEGWRKDLNAMKQRIAQLRGD